MEARTRGMLIPIETRQNGRWISPAEFANKARNGKGVKIKTVMDSIYSGRFKGLVKHDHFGWWIWEPAREVNIQPLKAA